MPLAIITPAPGANFSITPSPDWPGLAFATDGSGRHSWAWTLSWGRFSASGQQTTDGNTWDARAGVIDLGGTLVVRASCDGETASVTVKLIGHNPAAADVSAHVALTPGGRGFDKILAHETRMQHFNAAGEPIKSFDDGYGMAQLTNPAPSFAQVWNWKHNVDGGIALFETKVGAARVYLSQAGRSYTPDQLMYEAVCRWNGGKYHAWDEAAHAWVRNPDVLCDRATGNIGWDMTRADNTGRTEAELHARDQADYRHGPAGEGGRWGYCGVCYADAVLG